MSARIRARIERFPIAGSFVISRGARTEIVVVVAEIEADGFTGRGEGVPYAHNGETADGVLAAIEAVGPAGLDRATLGRTLAPGAARNALDCALWDLEAKRTGRRAWEIAGCGRPSALVTAYTLSLGTPESMAAAARKAAHMPLLKVKLGGNGDAERIAAVRGAAPRSRLIVDANEAWRETNFAANMGACAEAGVALVEQPLPAGSDELLREAERPVPVCADESVHVTADLDRLAGKYDAINIKLDKAGGLTEALALKKAAQGRGYRIMVGCMLGTSLGMSPAILVAADAEFVDLDGPLLLARDREPGLIYSGAIVEPPSPALWG
jgi:L-alanine-DL-glutamate epimerase-like enolase superfamily enzyme